MIRKNLFLYLVIIVLVLLNLILIGYFVSGAFQFSNKPAESEKEETINDFSKAMAFLGITCIESDFCKLDSNLFLEDESGKTIRLKDVTGGNLKIVMRYSDLDCKVCVDHQIGLLKDIGRQIGDTNIIILANYTRSRDLFLFKRINNLGIKVFNLGNPGLGVPMEKANTPFIFFLDKDLTTFLNIAPPKEIPEINSWLKRVLINKFNTLKFIYEK